MQWKSLPLNPFLLTLSLILLSFLLPPAYAEVYEADAIPWSGFWWPYSSGGLSTGAGYRGHPAPLEKYELLTGGFAKGPLVIWYNEQFYDPEAPGWYGFCVYWARAACYENIEILPSSEDNIVFRVGDKKGLLTLAHSRDITESADGSTPDIFHYWLLNYIKDQGKAFVADLDPGEEVWSFPIYRYIMGNAVNGDRESVTVEIYYADDNVRPDYMGTRELFNVYTYDLFLNEDGSISGGEWTGISIGDHPQKLSIPLMTGTSPYLDYEEVSRLARSEDDFLEEPGETVQISPGTYNLILLDEDSYKIDCLPGDTMMILLEKQNGSNENINVRVTDGSGDELKIAVVDDYEPMSLIISPEYPPCTVTVTQTDYSDPNIYTLKVDLKKARNQRIPYIPKNGMWSGFALTNSDDTSVNGVTLITYDKDGQPIQTVLGPLSMNPGERRVFLFDDLPWRQHEFSSADSLALISDRPVNFLNLFGSGNGPLAGFVQGAKKGSRLIIPDTAPSMTPGRNMFGGVTNESFFEEADVSLDIYSSDGALLTEIYEVIAPRGTLSINSVSYLFNNMPGSGWIEITETEDRLRQTTENPLTAYQYVNSYGKAESLFALPVTSSQKIIPHIPPPGYWRTTVTLINPNDMENQVSLHLGMAQDDHENDMTVVMNPREKRVLELHDRFGKREGEPFFHSLLKISGEYPVAGYYTYTSPKEEASCPLLDQSDFKEQLVLPHYAGSDGYWWTGVSVCNPGSFAVTANIEPYDNGRNLMEHIAEYVNIDAGYCEVFSVESFFGEAASELSFIKFRVEEDQGTIGGFYLYGNSTNEMLSGANM